MVRHTEVHGIPIPEPEDDPETVSKAITEYLDEVDKKLMMRGNPSERPASGISDRLFLDNSTNPPVLYFDRGDRWVPVGGLYDIPSNLARTDDEVTFTEKVSSEESVDADITGSASFAEEAEHADSADEASDFSGSFSKDDFLRSDREEEINESWDFSERQHFEEGIDVSGGTIDLPRYDGADPPQSMRNGPCAWFRDDHQPQG